MPDKKSYIIKGVKYLGLTLPLMILGPVLLSIGFRALKDGLYLWLILGIIIMLIAIITAFIGIRTILNGLFNTKK